MEIGVGLDASLGLSPAEEAEMAREAARLGYTSLWTPEGYGQDAFQLCLLRWLASRDVVPEGIATGIAVSPGGLRTPLALAMAAGTLARITGGRFTLGIGTGAAHEAEGRLALGMAPRLSTLALMRDYLVVTRGLLAGERVDYEGQTLALRGVRLEIPPAPRAPVYLGALGPEMLRLAGEMADGVALNWCAPEQVAWSRERVAEGAGKAGRRPDEMRVVEYIRICVDDDEDAARRALARAAMVYSLGPSAPTERERSRGYRGHFERMGFGPALAELDAMRERGASRDEVAAAFPPELLLRVGYFGRAGGARRAFLDLARGLDTAIVRVVAVRPGVEGALAVMRACVPAG